MELRTPHANGDSVLAKLDDFFIKLAVIAFALETLGAASEGARAAGGEDGGTLRRRRPEFDSCVVERHVREALLG